MAEYGPGATGGRVAFTGYTHTLGTSQSTIGATTGHAAFNGMTQADGHLSRMLRKRGNRVLRELLITLVEGASGATAAETYKRIKAYQENSSVNQGGGLVTMETATQINRATAAADLVDSVAAISRTVFPGTYATDLSGNGAGHMAGW